MHFSMLFVFCALLMPLNLVAGNVGVKSPPKKLNVVTTLPVLKALTAQIGGDHVSVASLSTYAEDPHFIKPKPTFSYLLNRADLFIENGRELELWVPKALESAGNKKLTGK